MSRSCLASDRPSFALSSPGDPTAFAGDSGAGFSLTANCEMSEGEPPPPPPPPPPRGPPRARARRSCAPSSIRRRRATKDGVTDGVDDANLDDPAPVLSSEGEEEEEEEEEDNGGGGSVSSNFCALKPASPRRTAVRVPAFCFGTKEVVLPGPVPEDAADSNGEVTTRASSFFAKEPSTWVKVWKNRSCYYSASSCEEEVRGRAPPNMLWGDELHEPSSIANKVR